jgi:hypothetical protein
MWVLSSVSGTGRETDSPRSLPVDSASHRATPGRPVAFSDGLPATVGVPEPGAHRRSACPNRSHAGEVRCPNRSHAGEVRCPNRVHPGEVRCPSRSHAGEVSRQSVRLVRGRSSKPAERVAPPSAGSVCHLLSFVTDVVPRSAREQLPPEMASFTETDRETDTTVGRFCGNICSTSGRSTSLRR